MATLLSDVIDELKTTSSSLSRVADVVQTLSESISEKSNIQALLKPLQNIETQLVRVIANDGKSKLKEEENRREESARIEEERTHRTEIRQASDPISLADAFRQGLGITAAYEVFHNTIGRLVTSVGTYLFGAGGIMMLAAKSAGRFVRLGAIGALVATFGEAAIGQFFDYLGQNFNIEIDQDTQDTIAAKVTDGVAGGILAGLLTKNPLARIGIGITYAFRDQIIDAVKWLFGVETRDDGTVVATLPFVGEIDLGESMGLIETAITGIAAALAAGIALIVSRRLNAGVSGLIGRLLGNPGTRSSAARTVANTAAAGATAGAARAATISAAQRTALGSLDDAALAAQGMARNASGQIVRQGTNQFISNAEQLNLLAATRNSRFARLLSYGRYAPALGAIIASGQLAAVMLNDDLSEDQKIEEVGAIIGSTLGGLSGFAAGGLIAGALGSTTGPGAFLTGLGGALVGGFAGDWAGREVARFIITGSTDDRIPGEVLNNIQYEEDFGSPGGHYSIPEHSNIIPAPVETDAGRMRLYDEFGGYRNLTRVEQQGDLGRLLGTTTLLPSTLSPSGPSASALGSISPMGGSSATTLFQVAPPVNPTIINNIIDNSDNSNTTIGGGGGGSSSRQPAIHTHPSNNYELPIMP